MNDVAEESPADGSAQKPAGDSTVPFDAIANLKLLGEVQRRGLEAANLIIARLTERTNASDVSTAPTGQQDQMTAIADAFIESVSAVATAMSLDPGSVDRAPNAQPDRAGLPGVLSARVAPGESTDAQLWMHNYTDDLATGIEIHLTDLIASHGSRLSAGCVSLQPDQPFDLTPASSRSVTMTIDLPPDTPIGRYRGVLTAAHLADLWLVLDVDVYEADSGPGSPVSAPETAASNPAP
jgi:hypothetical protein